jgi:hypothetical protein
MAPEVENRLAAAIAEGSLRLIAAKIIDIAPHADGARVTYRRRGRDEADHMNVAAIVDCSGIVSDLGATTNPALRSLLAQGLARIDPLHIGLDVGSDGALIDRGGPHFRSRSLDAVAARPWSCGTNGDSQTIGPTCCSSIETLKPSGAINSRTMALPASCPKSTSAFSPGPRPPHAASWPTSWLANSDNKFR